MDLKEIGNLGKVRHPWETARSRHFRRVIETSGLAKCPTDWMDVGSGDAYFASEAMRLLAPGSTMTCWDLNYDAAMKEKLGAQYPNVTFTAEQPAGRFGALLLLDVLEHIEDDLGFLTGIVKDHLVDGGHALVSVPAWTVLSTRHDVYLEHFRRYSPASGARLLESAGLTILQRGGLFHTLLVARAAERVKDLLIPERPGARQTGGATWNAGRLLSNSVSAALELEGKLSRWTSARDIDVPGLSWWALCKK